MCARYQIVSLAGSESGSSGSSRAGNAGLPESQQLAALLAKDGQLILPLLDLVEQAQVAIDDLVDVMGRATIEAVLQMSAEQLAGPKQQGKRSDSAAIGRYRRQPGRFRLAQRGTKRLSLDPLGGDAKLR